MVVFSSADIVSDNSISGLVSAQNKIQQPTGIPQGGPIFRMESGIGILPASKTPILVDVEYGGWAYWPDQSENPIEWVTMGNVFWLNVGNWQWMDVYNGSRETLPSNTYREYVESDFQAILGNTYRNNGKNKYFLPGDHTPFYEFFWNTSYHNW